MNCKQAKNIFNQISGQNCCFLSRDYERKKGKGCLLLFDDVDLPVLMQITTECKLKKPKGRPSKRKLASLIHAYVKEHCPSRCLSIFWAFLLHFLKICCKYLPQKENYIYKYKIFQIHTTLFFTVIFQLFVYFYLYFEIRSHWYNKTLPGVKI